MKTTEEEVQQQNNLRTSVTGSRLEALQQKWKDKEQSSLGKQPLQVVSSVLLGEVRCIPAGTRKDKLLMQVMHHQIIPNQTHLKVRGKAFQS